METAKPRPEAEYVMCHCENNFTANIPLEDLLSDDASMLAYKYQDRPLEPDHGYPLRMFLPQRTLVKFRKAFRMFRAVPNDWRRL